jgi:hypothetical protein
MSKMLTAYAAIAVTAMAVWSGAANAVEREANGVRNPDRIGTHAVAHQRRAKRDWAPGSVYGEPYAYEPAYGAYADPNASVTRHGGAFGFGG